MRAQVNYHIAEGGGKSHYWLAKPVCLSTFLIAGLFFLFLSVPVLAQDAETLSPKTEIIQNDESGTVSIVIDGKTVGVFTKDGFHVLGDIVYSGTIRDAGEDVKTIIEEHNVYGGTDEE